MNEQHPPSALEQVSPGVLESPATPRRDLSGEATPPSRGRGWIWLLVLALVGAGAYYYWSHRPAHASTADPSAPAAGARGRGPMVTPVVTAKARRGDIGVFLNGLGAVTPIYTVTIKSRVDGQLMEVHYKEGDLVHQGDLLLEIDPRPYQVQLEQAEGQLIKDQAALDNARIDLARYDTLLKQNAVPEQTLATQKALVVQDEGIVKTDQGQIDNAKLNLVYCHITAPITGRIGLRLVDPGNIVHAADTNGLLVITQIQPISVIFTLAEDQLPDMLRKWRAGEKLRVDAYDRAGNKKVAQGVLATVDNQIDQTTGTLRLRANFDNADDALFPNQFVNARLLVEMKHNVTLLPTATIQRNSQMTYVWVVKPDSTVAVRQITVGTVEGDDGEITSGINPGESAVMTGVDKLQEGGKVNAQLASDTPARKPAK